MKYVDGLASLNVDVEGEIYKESIEQLRRRLGYLDSDINIPSVPSEAEEEEFFSIDVFAGFRCLGLMIRKRNTHLAGFFSETQSCKWFQFGSGKSITKHHLMDAYEAAFLGFDGGYDSLESVCGESRANTRLGKRALMEAVQKLATSNQAEVRARSLIVVIQMICDAIRFPDICNFLADHYSTDGGGGVVPDSWMLALKLDHQLPLSKYELDLQAENGVSVFEKTSLRDADNLPKPDLNFYCSRCRDSICRRNGGVMLEVFSVKIKGEEGLIYGTIKVNEFGGHYIYSREWDNPESANPRETILLTGPTYYTFSEDNIYISFNLMKMDEGGSSLIRHSQYVKTLLTNFVKATRDDVFDSDRDPMEEEEEEEEGGYTPLYEYQFGYNIFSDYGLQRPFDQPLYANIDGKYVSATMCYAWISDATSAAIEVKFIKRKGRLGEGEEEKQTAKVYGRLAAEFGDFTRCEVLLFRIRKQSGDYVELSPGQLIPLSRPTATVRCHSHLIVRADLYDYDSNDEIVKGSATFPGDYCGSSDRVNISGKFGEIEVKVKWRLF